MPVNVVHIPIYGHIQLMFWYNILGVKDGDKYEKLKKWDDDS